MRHADSAGAYRSFVLATLLITIFGTASGHIKNEATQFPDIEFSDARFDIVVLVGAGIIPETPVFEPDKALSNLELATWVALAEGLRLGGETPDIDALTKAALESGLVETLTGDATLADVDRLFFGGRLGVETTSDIPTKAQAATFIAAQLDTEVGAALLEKRRLRSGSGGEVTAVAIEEGHHGNAYVMTIGGTKQQMDEHGRVANGPTDLLQWEGRKVRRSFVRGEGDHAKWLYIEAEPREVAPVAEAMDVTVDTIAAPPPETDRRLLYGLLVAGFILAVGLFVSRRKSG